VVNTALTIFIFISEMKMKMVKAVFTTRNQVINREEEPLCIEARTKTRPSVKSFK